MTIQEFQTKMQSNGNHGTFGHGKLNHGKLFDAVHLMARNENSARLIENETLLRLPVWT